MDRDRPYFQEHPERFFEMTVSPTKNAERAVKYWQDKNNFLPKPVPTPKPMPLRWRLFNWAMTRLLGWKFIPAPIFAESPVFQNVIKQMDKNKCNS